jgi:hypothetical protein
MTMAKRLKPEDTRDLLRLAGGLVLGLGVLALAQRKEADYGAAFFFFVYLVPAVLLFGGGVLTIRDTGGLRPWQAVFSVFGLIFVTLTLFQFVDMIGASPDAQFNVFWIFGVTAALAAYAGMEAGIRFQLLAASLAFLISFMAFWDKIVGFADNDVLYRLALLVVAGILFYAGMRVWQADRAGGMWKFSELLTGAGIAAVLAFGAGITSALSAVAASIPFLAEPISSPNWYWDIALLLVSLALVGAGTLITLRGPVYVGAAGLFIFLSSIGGGGTNLVWPLALLVIGAGAILLSLRPDVTLGNRPRDLVKRVSGHPVARRRGGS